ncbi:MAG: hypothetical protein AB7G23_12080 [Vicinamibacterales bacterium]
MHGARPFADFFDPGYFLTLYASAAAQWLTRGSLLGEALLTSVAIGVAMMLTFGLVRRVSGSVPLALGATALCLLVPPRYYDWDKVLFYTAGLTLAWRYVDEARVRTLVAAGVVAGLAGLCRYDNGLFLAVLTLVALGAVHHREPKVLAHRVALLAAGAAVIVVPALLVLASFVPLSEVARQVTTYAATEGARSELLSLPPLPPQGVDGLAGLLQPAAVAALLYYALVASMVTAVLRLGLFRRGPRFVADAQAGVGHAVGKPLMPELRAASGGLADAVTGPASATANERARILSLVALAACVVVFILRDPVDARIGAAMPLLVVLAAWLLSGTMARSVESGQAGEHTHPQSPRRLNAMAMAVAGLLVLVVVLAGGSRLVSRIRTLPQALENRVARMAGLLTSPPDPAVFREVGPVADMVAYVRACTPAGSRVLATWFVPQLSYLADHGFAGGMPVFFGAHWSSVSDQETIVERLRAEPVPLAVVDPGFASSYSLVDAYLAEAYTLVGTSAFGSDQAPDGGYRVLVRSDLLPLATDPRWGLPCPAGTPAEGR